MAERYQSQTEVDQFILAHIDSVPHLESLLLLWHKRPGTWSSAEIAARLYIEPARASKLLQDLAREDLAAAVPESPEQDRPMELVSLAHSRELIRLSNLIHSKASPAVREFARAFRFTKEKE